MFKVLKSVFILFAFANLQLFATEVNIDEQFYKGLSDSNFNYFRAIPKDKDSLSKLKKNIKKDKKIIINAKEWSDTQIISSLRKVQEFKIRARIKVKYGYTEGNSYTWITSGKVPKEPYPVIYKLPDNKKAKVFLNYNGRGRCGEFQTGNNAVYDLRDNNVCSLPTYPNINSFSRSVFNKGLSDPMVNFLVLNEISRRLVVEKLKDGTKRYDKFKDLPVGIGVALYKATHDMLEDKKSKQKELTKGLLAKDGRYHMFSDSTKAGRKNKFLALFKYSIDFLKEQREIDIDAEMDSFWESESTNHGEIEGVILEYIEGLLPSYFPYPEYDG